MGGVRKANLNRPDDEYEFDHGRAETVNLGDLTIGRGIVEPGWRWSKHIKPIVKTSGARAGIWVWALPCMRLPESSAWRGKMKLS